MFPTLFVSHGAPTLALGDDPTKRFLCELGRSLGRPSAIVVASAHWETSRPRVTAVARNETIHDFYGFPPELYQMRYPAPGSTALAEEVSDLLCAAGLASDLDRSRGLDHGAWVPLSLMYPEADIPIVQISVQPELGPAHHRQVGLALTSLRQQEILIMGSGSFTHDLGRLRLVGPGEQPAPDVEAFADWMQQAILQDRKCDLLTYRGKAPHAERNHPTEEHLLPLFFAMGAAGGKVNAERIHAGTTFGVLRMDAYAFR